MVLVDTSVWVFHFRQVHSGLVGLLHDGEVACHPFVLGELACGNIKNRTAILALLEVLPMANAVEHQEVMTFIEAHTLMGKGLGYIDVHILASCILTGLPLWTLDKKLESIAEALHCKYQHSTR